MARRLPTAMFAMSLCQLKPGRVFSMANRKPRVGLVVTITRPGAPPIALLDVERTGDVALALIALRFLNQSTFDVVEAAVKRILDGLIDASGNWDRQVEKDLIGVCTCERLHKMLTPRSKIDVKGQTALWAEKLLRKLDLEPAPGT